MNSKRARAAVAALLVLTTAGCMMTGTEIDETPTFEQVTAEGEGALDRILGLLPEGTEITVREQGPRTPAPTGRCSRSVGTPTSRKASMFRAS